MTRVVVTGATGTLGRAVVQALLERGDSVVALSRDAGSRTLEAARRRRRPHVGRPAERTAAGRGAGGAGGVIHLLRRTGRAALERRGQAGDPRSRGSSGRGISSTDCSPWMTHRDLRRSCPSRRPATTGRAETRRSTSTRARLGLPRGRRHGVGERSAAGGHAASRGVHADRTGPVAVRRRTREDAAVLPPRDRRTGRRGPAVRALGPLDDVIGGLLFSPRRRRRTRPAQPDGSESGHEPRALEGARAGAEPSRVLPVPGFALGPVRRDGRDHHDWAARDSRASSRAGVRVPVHGHRPRAGERARVSR